MGIPKNYILYTKSVRIFSGENLDGMYHHPAIIL